MKVVILAAGYNRRLEDTICIPKTLLTIGSTTILERQITALTKAGLKKEDILIVVGYKHEMIEAVHGNVILNEKFIEYDNAYSVYLALDHLCKEMPEDSKESILIVDGDLVYDEALIKEILSSDKDNIIVTKEIEYTPDLKDEIMLTDDTSKINEMIIPEKGKKFDVKYQDRELFSYMGILKISIDSAKDLRDRLNHEEILKAWYTIPLVDMVNNGNMYNLAISKSLKFCFDIDDPKDRDKLMNLDIAG
jgi:choline kinase